MTDRDRTRHRALGALAAVVALALGVGVILAAGAYAAARMIGLTDGGGQPATAHVASAPHRTEPSSTPSAATSPSAKASVSTSPSSTSPSPAAHHQDAAAQAASQRQQARRQEARRRAQQRAARRQHRHRQARHHHHRHQRATGTVTLHASRTRVRPMGRVDLGGRCGCRSGTTLVVQRLEHGHWARFPATATASRGRFRTWVMTGRHGANQFRVVAPGGGVSNPVTIMVG